MSKKPEVPAGLGESGAALWLSIAPKYVLRSDEVARLASACRVADTVQMLEDTWRELGYPMVSVGSMKQEVIHPLIGEIRTQRSALDRMLAGLKLPDDESGVEVNQNRSAAQSSWAPGAARGRGA